VDSSSVGRVVARSDRRFLLEVHNGAAQTAIILGTIGAIAGAAPETRAIAATF
jgi:hypothetical protein